jgi:hypothetical protein
LPAVPPLAAGELAVAISFKGGEGKGMVVKVSKLPWTRVPKDSYPFVYFS